MLFQLQNVTKTYGNVTALRDLSVQVPECAVGLLGPNGSGKTTLIRTLLGLISIDSGGGDVLGMDFRTRRLDVRQAVGFVPEDECLFPGVVGVEFVAYAGELGGMGRKDALQRAHEVLDYVGLGEARYRRVETYSTGMKQRLKLGSAIVHDPRLLILDEPTNGMDPAGREEIIGLARDLAHNKGMSLLFSSHLLPDVEAVCEYVVVLGSGRLLAQGNIQELKQFHQSFYEVRTKTDPERFARLLGAAGCRATPREDMLLVEVPAGADQSLVWRTAAEAGQQIRYLRPQRSTLEEVFLKAVSERLLMPVFDQGYQHWKGTLHGHAWRWLAVTRQGVRARLKSRWFLLVLVSAWVPALGLAAVLIFWGLLEQKADFVLPYLQLFRIPSSVLDSAREFRVTFWTLAFHYFLVIETFFSMGLVVLVGPSLISQDLRFNAIPLYLSRPLRRFDYFLGKLGVIGTFLLAVIVLPAVVAYVLGVCFSLDLGIIKDTFGILCSAIGYGLVVSLSAGTFMLALSSLTRRSVYVGAVFVGVLLIGAIVSGILEEQARWMNQRRAMEELQLRPPRRQFRPGEIYRPTREEELYWLKVSERQEEAMREQSQSDWRPLVSYFANLQRLGDSFLDTNAAWLKIAATMPSNRGNWLLNRLTPEYPWYWSGAVLAGLFGLSLWILTSRVKSLDRLR